MRKTFVYSAVALLGAELCLAAQQPAGTPAPPASSGAATASNTGSVSIRENIPYGPVNGQPLLLDVYEPPGHAARPCPAVVLIHGGGWTSFDKGTMRGMAQLLARSGLVAFSVDYRLFHGTENRWPAQLDDVQRAVRWVRANAPKYEVNPDRIGAFGHSASSVHALRGATRAHSDLERDTQSSMASPGTF